MQAGDILRIPGEAFDYEVMSEASGAFGARGFVIREIRKISGGAPGSHSGPSDPEAHAGGRFAESGKTEGHPAQQSPPEEPPSRTYQYPGEGPAATPGEPEPMMRQFDSGATRNRDDDALGVEGFTSPLALLAYCEYMHRHRFTADGGVRDPDNWQRGIPRQSYMESLRRHELDLQLIHDGYPELARESLKDALCALLFNVQGYLHSVVLDELNEARADEEEARNAGGER